MTQSGQGLGLSFAVSTVWLSCRFAIGQKYIAVKRNNLPLSNVYSNFLNVRLPFKKKKKVSTWVWRFLTALKERIDFSKGAKRYWVLNWWESGCIVMMQTSAVTVGAGCLKICSWTLLKIRSFQITGILLLVICNIKSYSHRPFFET